jgi:broad specificity phosphatase PhoE
VTARGQGGAAWGERHSSARLLVFWRHGRTSWNAERRFQGQTDIPLDETGVAQAARAAKALARLKPDRIIASDLLRARATASELAALSSLSIRTDPDLRETFAGEWEGLTRTELEERFGSQLAQWGAGADVRPGGGETRVEVAVRVVAAVERALADVGPGQTLVVATHGGSARAGIGALLGLPPEHWAALGVLANCAWSVLQENTTGFGPAWRLQEYNAGSLPVAALADDH